MKKQILSLSGSVLFEYDCETVKELVEKAVKSGANLSRANLSGANLSGANLYGANLSRANLSGANLYGANLSRANLCGANLYGASLSGADLCGADLCGANLYGASLSGADLSGANLSGANLSGANLSGADLSGADLYGAHLFGANLSGAKDADYAIAQTRILPEGDIIGYKKCLDGIIVKLLIPKEAKRSSAFGRKCRAEYADVLEIYGAEKATSSQKGLIYEAGKRVYHDKWDDNWQEECSHGIHFFITKLEAEKYSL